MIWGPYGPGEQTEYGEAAYAPGKSVGVRPAQITEDSFTEPSVKSRNIIRINRFLSVKRTILQSSCYIIYNIFPGRSQRPSGGDWKSPGKCGKIAENKRGKGMCDAYTGFIRFPWVRGPYGAVRGAGAAPGDPASGGLRAGRSAAGGARISRCWGCPATATMAAWTSRSG